MCTWHVGTSVCVLLSVHECVLNCSTHNLTEGCLLCLCYSVASDSLTPADIHPASSAHREKEKERGEGMEGVCLRGCVCVPLRGPYRVGGGSGLIICIFSFELLFAALRAAQTPTGRRVIQ